MHSWGCATRDVVCTNASFSQNKKTLNKVQRICVNEVREKVGFWETLGRQWCGHLARGGNNGRRMFSDD